MNKTKFKRYPIVFLWLIVLLILVGASGYSAVLFQKTEASSEASETRATNEIKLETRVTNETKPETREIHETKPETGETSKIKPETGETVTDLPNIISLTGDTGNGTVIGKSFRNREVFTGKKEPRKSGKQQPGGPIPGCNA